MIKGLFIILTILLLTSNVQAGPGHDHGSSGFANTQTSSFFVLSDKQIKNLHLKQEFVKYEDFYSVITIPMVLKKHSEIKENLVSQGFVLEGALITKIKKDQEVSIKIDAAPDKEYHGKIFMIDEMIDPRTRLYSVYALLNDELPRNWQGMKGDMQIKITSVKEAISIPSSALQGEFGHYYVFVMKGNHFEKREIEIGQQEGNRIEVIKGLALNEVIVTQGSYQLKYVTGIHEDEHEHDEHEYDNEYDEHNQHDEHDKHLHD